MGAGRTWFRDYVRAVRAPDVITWKYLSDAVALVKNLSARVSWRQQPGTPVYGTAFDGAGLKRALSEASRARRPEWRATPYSPGDFAKPA